MDDFSREHVLNEAFGEFDPGAIIHCVCAGCNQAFGNTFDRKFARDSPFSIARVRERSLPTPTNKGEGRRTTTSLRFTTGPWKGALGRYRALLDGEPPPPTGERLVLEPLPQLGFKREVEAEFVWFLLENPPTAEAVLHELGASEREAVAACVIGVTSDVEAAAAIRRVGLCEVSPGAPQPPYVDALNANATFEISSPELRTVTKMALSYVALSQSPEIACMSQFDVARRFVVDGVEPDPPLVHTCLNTWPEDKPDARGHYLAVQTYGAQGVVAQVSVLLELRHIIYLARGGPALPAEFSSGHFFDLHSMRASPIGPPPMPTVSPTSMAGRYARKLTLGR